MSVFLWFAVMVAMGSASNDFLEFRRQVFEEDVVKEPKPTACSNINYQIIDKLVKKAGCALREVYLGLLPPFKFLSVNPGSLWVKRCVGHCDYEETGFTCRPAKTARRDVPITLYNAKTAKYHCSIFTIEEHVSCHCDDPESTCTAEGVTLDIDPPSGDDALAHPGINPGTVWIKQCKGSCSAYDSNCMPSSVILTEVVTAKGAYKAEEHDTCRCDSDLLPCTPRDTYIELPTNYESVHPSLDFGLFVTKRCSGNCSNSADGYQCMPLKREMRNVYDTLWQVEEDINCVCAKKMEP